MSISLTGVGGLYTILGHIACAARNTNGRRGSSNPDTTAYWGSSGPIIRCLETEIDNIIAGYSTIQQPYYDGIRTMQAAYVTAHDTYISGLVSLVTNAVTKIVQADNPQPNTSTQTIMTEVIRQMVGASQTVKRCVVGSSVAAGGSNVGNPTVLCSTTGRYGAPLEYVMAETMVGLITADADGNGTGTASAGNEPMAITGGPALTNKFDVLWPAGSSANANITIVDPTQDNAGGNLLTNSSFETFTVTNQPDDWTVLVGSVGTSVLKSATNTYASSSACLQFVGDGAELTSVTQTFGSQTDGTLLPATVYAINGYARVSATPASGVLKIDLIDSTNTVINDDAGTANTVTLALTSISTSYVAINGFFRTPTNIPSTMKLRIRLSTALDNAKTVNIDYVALTPATQLYIAGPYVAAFRGSTDVSFGDRFTFAITNDRAGIIQTFCEQAFGMSSMGLILPSASSPTISDSLVV